MVTQREFAKLRGVTPKSVQIWKSRGLIVFAPVGGVDVEASEKLLDARPEVFRGGKVASKPSPESGTRSEPLSDPALADVPPAVLAEASSWSLAEAARKKEIALACLRQLEFDKESGLVVPIADVAKAVSAEYSIVRDRVLAMPGKLADEIANLDRRGIEARLRAECYECLSELNEASYGRS